MQYGVMTGSFGSHANKILVNNRIWLTPRVVGCLQEGHDLLNLFGPWEQVGKRLGCSTADGCICNLADGNSLCGLMSPFRFIPASPASVSLFCNSRLAFAIAHVLCSDLNFKDVLSQEMCLAGFAFMFVPKDAREQGSPGWLK